MLSVFYSECHIQALYAHCHHAECRYAEYDYSECNGAIGGAPPGHNDTRRNDISHSNKNATLSLNTSLHLVFLSVVPFVMLSVTILNIFILSVVATHIGLTCKY
jgi:hypothetical protein